MERTARTIVRPSVRLERIEAEVGYHASFVLPVTYRQILAAGIEMNHEVGWDEADEVRTLNRKDAYRMVVSVRAEGGAEEETKARFSLEMCYGPEDSPVGVWVSATTSVDPETGEKHKTAATEKLVRLFQTVVPDWDYVLGMVRLRVIRERVRMN